MKADLVPPRPIVYILPASEISPTQFHATEGAEQVCIESLWTNSKPNTSHRTRGAEVDTTEDADQIGNQLSDPRDPPGPPGPQLNSIYLRELPSALLRHEVGGSKVSLESQVND